MRPSPQGPIVGAGLRSRPAGVSHGDPGPRPQGPRSLSQRLIQSTLLLLTLLSAPLQAALSESELQALFVEANQHFRQANESSASNPITAEDLYRRSALRFQRIVEEGGIRNGKLFFNIGNAYFRTGDIGRAILNYRRAEQYIPSDADLAHNLNYARSTRLDSFEEQQQTQVLKTLLFWHYDFSPRLRSNLLAVFSLLFWGLAALRLFRPEWVAPIPWVAGGVLAAAFLGSLTIDAYRQSRESPGVLVAQQVIARKGDGQSYERSFKEPLHAGTEFVLLEDRGDWRHIELPGGRQCWVPSAASELVQN